MQDGSKRIATQFRSPKGPAVAALERPICLLGAWGLPGSTGSARDSCRGLLLTRNAHVQLARTGRCPSDQPNRLNWIVIDGVHLGGISCPLRDMEDTSRRSNPHRRFHSNGEVNGFQRKYDFMVCRPRRSLIISASSIGRSFIKIR